MSILGKLAFWKRNDDVPELTSKENLAFGDNYNQYPGYDQNQPQNFSQPGFGFEQFQPRQPIFQPQYPSYQPQRYDPGQDINSKNLEIINSKIDALRATLDSINQRLSNLEAIARGEEDKRRRYF